MENQSDLGGKEALDAATFETQKALSAFSTNGTCSKCGTSHPVLDIYRCERIVAAQNLRGALEAILVMAEQGCVRRGSRFHTCNCDCDRIAAVAKRLLSVADEKPANASYSPKT